MPRTIDNLTKLPRDRMNIGTYLAGFYILFIIWHKSNCHSYRRLGCQAYVLRSTETSSDRIDDFQGIISGKRYTKCTELWNRSECGQSQKYVSVGHLRKASEIIRWTYDLIFHSKWHGESGARASNSKQPQKVPKTIFLLRKS